MRYTLQVAPEDCTGCGLCVEVCPVEDQERASTKAINMAPQPPLRERERANWDFFLDAPETRPRARRTLDACTGLQLPRAAVRVLRRLRGLRRDAVSQAAHRSSSATARSIANATGCSSIYGGNLPTTPWTTNARGPRPGLGELALRGQRRVRARHAPGARQAAEYARELLARGSRAQIGDDLVRRPPRRADQIHRERASTSSASAWPHAEGTARRAIDDAGGRGRCARSPTSLVRRASGSSAATAGPTTSASAASTTCSPAGAT